MPTPNNQQPVEPTNLTSSEQLELEAIANEVCDTEFDHLWQQVQHDSKDLNPKDLAEEFFYQGILQILAIQKMEEKEIEEQEARRFQNE